MRQIFVFLATLGTGVMTSLAFAGEYDLVIEKKAINLTGRDTMVPTINGSVPGPALRWREGEEVLIRVTNPTSLHWHGIILRATKAGVTEQTEGTSRLLNFVELAGLMRHMAAKEGQHDRPG